MISKFDKLLEKAGEYGEVMQVKHPIVAVNGLPGARLHEMIIFENGVLGEVFAVLADQVQVSVFSQDPLPLRMKATYLNKFLSVPVGMELFGHAIDPLGRPISSDKSYKEPKEEREIDVAPLGIDSRAKIDQPLLTGISVVDLMIPLGKGQKELVLGDRKVGKTGFLLSVMKNQVKLGTKVVYAAVARGQSEVKRVQKFFQDEGISEGVIVVASLSHDSPSLIFLTPYSAMAIAEYLRDAGHDVLVVFDDLSAHAKFYREISLIAKRFPGRDSFPGDIFYIHSRLMERAGNFKTSSGVNSISALASVEIAEGDLTGFISTNLMSMTDGHILFDNNIFYQGQRPAVNIAFSVTRVGRQAQSPLLRDVNKELTVFFNKYEKLENLAHFGAELTGEAKTVLGLGGLLKRLFQQGYGATMPLEAQLVCLSLIWLNLLSTPSAQPVSQPAPSASTEQQDVKKTTEGSGKSMKEEELLDKIKGALNNVFQKPESETWKKEIASKASFKELQEWVKTEKDKIAVVCTKEAKTEIKFEGIQPVADALAKTLVKPEIKTDTPEQLK